MIDEIVKTFEGLTPILWVSQISGLIGLLIIGIAYLFKKKAFIAIGIAAFIFFIIEQACAGLVSNLIVSTTCLIRNIFMLILLIKKNEELPRKILFIFIGIMWALVLTYMAITKTFNAWDNYLPPAIVTMSTITQNSKNEFVVKIGALFHEGGFLLYYSIYHLPFSMLRQGILVIACLIGIVILVIKTIKYKKEKEIIIEE